MEDRQRHRAADERDGKQHGQGSRREPARASPASAPPGRSRAPGEQVREVGAAGHVEDVEAARRRWPDASSEPRAAGSSATARAGSTARAAWEGAPAGRSGRGRTRTSTRRSPRPGGSHPPASAPRRRWRRDSTNEPRRGSCRRRRRCPRPDERAPPWRPGPAGDRRTSSRRWPGRRSSRPRSRRAPAAISFAPHSRKYRLRTGSPRSDGRRVPRKAGRTPSISAVTTPNRRSAPRSPDASRWSRSPRVRPPPPPASGSSRRRKDRSNAITTAVREAASAEKDREPRSAPPTGDGPAAIAEDSTPSAVSLGVWELAWPTIISYATHTLVRWADLIMVGPLGREALAGGRPR